MQLPSILHTIATECTKQDAKAIIVGGSVRDHFLQLPTKDYDIEVYGFETLEQLVLLLEQFGSVNLVGKSYGVVKFGYEGEVYDFSLPRTESKVGRGHRGFEVTVDGRLDFEEASRRRDFRMNALGYDIEKQRFLDPFGGLKDIADRCIRHIEDTTFREDPLRVYRAIQFASRFGFTIAEETLRLCQKMVEEGMLAELPKERVYAEWQKLLLKSAKPSVGFESMRLLGILERYFPELHAIVGVPQSPKWHPEGDVWIHTMMALDVMAALLKVRDGRWGEKEKLRFLFAILCHDLGKATTTTIVCKDGTVKHWQEIPKSLLQEIDLDTLHSIKSLNHEKAGIEPTRKLLYRLTEEHTLIESILPLVAHHLKPSQFYSSGAKAAAIRRLATKVTIEDLVLVAKADFLGRTTSESLMGRYPAGEWLLEKSRALQVSSKPLDCLLQGRDLIALGLQPSPRFREILDTVYRAQIEGELMTKEEALAFVRERYL